MKLSQRGRRSVAEGFDDTGRDDHSMTPELGKSHQRVLLIAGGVGGMAFFCYFTSGAVHPRG